MFVIKIIAVGNLKAKPLRALAQEYEKRLKPFAKFERRVIPEQPFRSLADRASVLKKENVAIRTALKNEDVVVVLDAAGKTFSSEAFARTILDRSENETHPITFVLGGPLGLSDETKKEADLLLSLSPMTFTHEMAELLLLEQLYRAMTILKGKMYHY